MAILGPPGTPKMAILDPPGEGGETPQNGHFGGFPPSPPFLGVLGHFGQKPPKTPILYIWLRRE